MRHEKFEFVKTLIANKVQVMLEGEAGSGKTTMIMDVAEELSLKFYSVTGTQQTSVANLLGFRSVTGDYISTQLREAYEFGGLYLIDEYDGMNPNTILALNSIENGFLAFPDRVVQAHPDFFLCATTNPADNHAAFTGRSKQDAAALDRFLKVVINRDGTLEEALTSKAAVAYASKMRGLLRDYGVVSRVITMRDTIRLHQLMDLSTRLLITENPLDTLIGPNTELSEALYAYSEIVAVMDTPLSSTKSIKELHELIQKKTKGK